MTLLFNFGLMSLLLLAAQVLRGRVGVLQAYCIPSAIVAGFLALIAGPNGFNWLPFRESETLADYPRMLVIILFATLFPGTQVRQRSPGALIRQVGDTFFYSLASQFGQYGLALLFGLFILAPLFPSLNPAFALMLPSGFAGGPGVATVTAQSLQRTGWDEALSVGLTFATLGQLVGIVGGILLINLAMRLGWTRLVRSPEELPAGLKSGFVPAGQQVACGRETVSSFVLDSFTWHLAIVLAAVMIGQALGDGLKAIWPALDFPVFALAMLSGVFLQVVLDQIGIGRSVDRGTITRIGSLASDFLIAFGICAIQPRVVGAYVVPIILMGLFGVAYSVAIFWFLGRRLYRNYWFERGLFTYGWNTGLVGTGVALLRVVDPRQKSGTLEDYGIAYLFIASLDIALVVVLPPLVGAGHILVPAVVLTGMGILMALTSARLVGWFTRSPTAVRQGELVELICSTDPLSVNHAATTSQTADEEFSSTNASFPAVVSNEG